MIIARERLAAGSRLTGLLLAGPRRLRIESNRHLHSSEPRAVDVVLEESSSSVEIDSSVKRLLKNKRSKDANRKLKERYRGYLQSFSGALQALVLKTTPQVTSRGTKMSQEERLRSSLKGGYETMNGKADQARNSSKPKNPSHYLVSALIKNIKKSNQVDIVLEQLKYLNTKKLYTMPEWQVVQFLRGTTVKGYYSKIAPVLSQSHAYGFTLGSQVQQELLRIFAYAAKSKKWQFTKANKIQNIINKITISNPSDIVKFNSQALGCMSILASNQSREKMPSAVESDIKKYAYATRDNWDEFTLPSAILERSGDFAEIERSLVDYTLSANGLVFAADRIQEKKLKTFCKFAANLLVNDIEITKGLISQEAQKRGKKSFSNFNLDIYRLAAEESPVDTTGAA
ncbi:hypothetical protein V1511DRAFT_242159 [Dipodascopsis uninucleata]